MSDVYRKYFDIDSDYFPQVNDGVMRQNPDLWKKYYPHESFVQLLQATLNALGREGRSGSPSIWVYGSYGTGKSHAVLTLKKLIDATSSEAREYFERFSDLLSTDMYNRLLNIKNRGKTLTVHRYGSSNIRNDDDLVVAVQTSIMEELERSGLDRNEGLGDAILKWLKQSGERNYFSTLLKTDYYQLFNGQSVEDIEEKLRSDTGNSLRSLICNIMRVGKERGIKMFTMSIDDLRVWIKRTIESNNLHSIVFIWDEFSEYLINNKQSLTGFQRLVELANETSFYMLVVAHAGEHFFDEKDNGRKLLDRFSKPFIEFKLPEHMAFTLLAEAMKKTSDPLKLQEWKEYSRDLIRATTRSRQFVSRSIHFSDAESLENDFKDILPLQPYTALLLKNIAAIFSSNQRSIFDFIQNAANNDYHGFQWFIDNYGPLDEDPLFLPDMLWDYYEKGKGNFEPSVRKILEYYDNIIYEHELEEESKRVLKVVLLLQAICEKQISDCFLPTSENVQMAFEGSEYFKNDAAKSLLNKLVEMKILFTRTANKKVIYNAMMRIQDNSIINEYVEKLSKKATSEFVDLDKIFTIPKSISFRCSFRIVDSASFAREMSNARTETSGVSTKQIVLVLFAKNDCESVKLQQMVNNVDDFGNAIVIDTTLKPLGDDRFDDIVNELAQFEFLKPKNKDQALSHQSSADDKKKEWYSSIQRGDFIVIRKSNDQIRRVRVATMDQLYTEIQTIVRERYPYAIDVNFTASDTMWGSTNMKDGVKCAQSLTLKAVFKSKDDSPVNLERQLRELWSDDESVWDEPYRNEAQNAVMHMRNAIEPFIQNAFREKGRVSMASIYAILEREPYAMLPCNLSAFVIGFLLRKYVSQTYTWSNDISSDKMTPDKLGEMVASLFKVKIDGAGKYREEYIVRDKEEIRFFREEMKGLFNLDEKQCDSIENTRGAMRTAIKKLYAPILIVKTVARSEKLTSSEKDISEIVDLISRFLSCSDTERETENDIAIKIGKKSHGSRCITDLKTLIKPAKMKKGVQCYIHEYKNGELEALAQKINDQSECYIDDLKKKLDASPDAKWLWRPETFDSCIDRVIDEYKIIDLLRGEYNNQFKPFDEAIREWCDKFNNLKIPYVCLQDIVGDKLRPAMRMCYEVTQSCRLEPDHYNEFIQCLENCQVELQNFFSFSMQRNFYSQITRCEQKSLSSEEIDRIYASAKKGMWNKPRAEFEDVSESYIQNCIKETAIGELTAKWRSMTDTDNPKMWSDRYHMPILCMFKNDEQKEAECFFDIINTGKGDTIDIQNATSFLDRGTFFQRLDDAKARSDAFHDTFNFEYDQIISDDEIHRVLDGIGEEPYDWYNSNLAKDAIRKYAEKQYLEVGASKALDKIDQMSPERLKEYLKDLVANNFRVGMEIIRDQD